MTLVLGLLPKRRAEQPIDQDSLRPLMTTRGERVAIVDDEEVMTSVTAAVLERLGYTTSTFSCASRFAKAFNASPEKFDLVVTDVVMPGFSGVQLVRTLREHGHEVPVLLMTGFSVQTRLETGGSAGRISFVRKPFTPLHLAQSVRRLLIAAR
jgi:two-component system cell cycle sensor histidine kinase/response regulator CckA